MYGPGKGERGPGLYGPGKGERGPGLYGPGKGERWPGRPVATGGEGGFSPPPLEKFEPPLGCAVPFAVTIGIEVYPPPLEFCQPPPPANDTWLRRWGGACECPRVGAFFKLMTSRGQCPRGVRLVFHPSKFRPPPPTWLAGYGPDKYIINMYTTG